MNSSKTFITEVWKKTDLISNYGFTEILDENFDVLFGEHHEKHGVTTHSMKLYIEREKGKEEWGLGSMEVGNHQTKIKTVKDALDFISKVRSATL